MYYFLCFIIPLDSQFNRIHFSISTTGIVWTILEQQEQKSDFIGVTCCLETRKYFLVI